MILMKKTLFLALFFLIAGLFYFNYSDNLSKNQQRNTKQTKQPLGLEAKLKKSVFVPDWSLKVARYPTSEVATLAGEFDRWIYFGPPSSQLSSGLRKGKEWWFTLKITELEDEKKWSSIVDGALDIAKDYSFDGIVLDLEINGLPTDKLVTQINNFVKYFYTEVKKDYIKLAVAVYGDVFYRKRPYDVKSLAENSDEIMVMAYDFHKSRGEPGPNFPYEKGNKYNYDFKTMIDDFLRFIPPEKLTVIFGMYGYDWMVDEGKKPIKPAKALTLNEIRQKFQTKCQWKDCVVARDDLSQETEVNYVIPSIKDNFAYLEYHIVWFEDEQSVKIKTQYLRKKGIGSIAYWAWGYF